ncbi:glycoside hydrolase family 15 protein [Tautonia sociabilis]|uniref:Glycosyl hydrolase n=1 Tax=Tautonia sociabilis TaxID=2080755 RepID=A0A432MR57_9BACT|nr:glycosyl hydrolase [Tautonia sociabilis]RUL89739.1 glycosyl hydrolase [Tautonia sociabilis]
MLTSWIEAAASGRHGGPIRAGMWGSVVLGSHPADRDETRCGLELIVDDEPVGLLPAYWLEDRGVNSLWHAPVPPQRIGSRLRYRPIAQREGEPDAEGPWREVLVRPNLPDRTDPTESQTIGVVGNRHMTARVDDRGATFDVFFPTVGLHSDVRPAEGDLPNSRSHFRTIVGGLAIGARLDWFNERMSWDCSQRYRPETNLLETELRWRRGPVRVLAVDFAATGPDLPRTGGGLESRGQYLKRFRIVNEGTERHLVLFGLYVHSEVNGGIGEPSLSWQDSGRCLLAANRGHSHANRKLARDATVEFAIALDDRGPVDCEPTGASEAIVLRPIELRAGGEARVDVLISGAFTGWRGDQGTFEHWLHPALDWFRSVDLDAVEQATTTHWVRFVRAIPSVESPRPGHGEVLRRSALAAVLHCDAEHGSVAAGFDRGLNAYCWPRDALWAASALDRLGHLDIGAAVFDWLARVRGRSRTNRCWFMKYTIDGVPEWETPAIDQTALVPWALERHVRSTGDLDLARRHWPLVERMIEVCFEGDGHPGLFWSDELDLFSSAGLWETRFGAYLSSNACVVAGLRAAARLARLIDPPDAARTAAACEDRADRIWQSGIFGEGADRGEPGLVDPRSGRFLEGRRISTRLGFWPQQPGAWVERSAALDIGVLGLAVPLDLLPASDPRLRRTAGAMLVHNVNRADPGGLTRWAPDPARIDDASLAPSESHRDSPSSLATLWMARYLIRLGRETGEARHWAQAVEFLDRMIARLGPLGLNLRPGPRMVSSPSSFTRCFQGVWGLHTMLIDTILDLAEFRYDALDRRLTLRPILPPSWPRIGLSRTFPCGRVGFRFERPVGGRSHRLTLSGRIEHPVQLVVELTCPGLGALGPWSSRPSIPAPRPDLATGRLSWSIALPPGDLDACWSWGEESGEWISAV